MSSDKTAIEITAGVSEWTSRLSLKKTMEQFGEVLGCHIGNRGVDFPVVRFSSDESADRALQALRSGQVWIDGLPLAGEWRGTTAPKRRDDRPAEGKGGGREEFTRESGLEMTSRDFLPGGQACTQEIAAVTIATETTAAETAAVLRTATETADGAKSVVGAEIERGHAETPAGGGARPPRDGAGVRWGRRPGRLTSGAWRRGARRRYQAL